MILLDTSGLLANYDRRDRWHADAAQALAVPQRRILSPFVLAELDYLVMQVGGQEAELTVLDDVARGAYELAPFDGPAVDRTRSIMAQYADLGLGLADASIVVLALQHGCHDILTLDQRRFRAVLGPDHKPFRLLPQDSQ